MAQSLSPETLLAHRGWIRTLARRLVRDPHLAADLEQATWLAALSQRSAAPASVRAWLATVMRNALNSHARSSGRRREREASAARVDRSQSTAELVQEASAQRRVVSAVLELEEPVRTAVLLRYFRELTLKEVAEHQGVPLSTAASRVEKGLESLRVRLEREFGADRKAWTALLLPCAVGPAAPPAAHWIPLLMSNSRKVLVACALIAAALTAFFLLRSTSAPREAGSDSVAALAPSPSSSGGWSRANAARLPPIQAPAELPEEVRSSIATEPPPAEPVPATPKASVLRIRGVVADFAGAELMPGQVALQRSGTSSPVFAMSSATVGFAFEGLEPGRYELWLDDPLPRGYVAAFHQKEELAWKPVLGAPRHLGTEVELRAGAPEVVVLLALFRTGTVQGRALGPQGERLAGASIRLQCLEPHLDELRYEVESEYDGMFVVESMYPGRYRVEADVADRALVPGASNPRPFEFQLEPGELEILPDTLFEAGPGKVRGVVTAGRGRPLANATVLAWYAGSIGSGATLTHWGHAARIAVTDDEGRFELDGLPAAELAIQLVAEHTGQRPWRALSEATDVDLRRASEPVELFIQRTGYLPFEFPRVSLDPEFARERQVQPTDLSVTWRVLDDPDAKPVTGTVMKDGSIRWSKRPEPKGFEQTSGVIEVRYGRYAAVRVPIVPGAQEREVRVIRYPQ